MLLSYVQLILFYLSFLFSIHATFMAIICYRVLDFKIILSIRTLFIRFGLLQSSIEHGIRIERNWICPLDYWLIYNLRKYYFASYILIWIIFLSIVQKHVTHKLNYCWPFLRYYIIQPLQNAHIQHGNPCKSNSHREFNGMTCIFVSFNRWND